ncbi:MAG TPA: polyprenol monophosphomannose synthase [Polyangiaceae bacterium]|nr:polyprenol monophosphomannose synthase [Polyangiaceae bacterium]
MASLPATSIVVPTFREVEALPDLIERVARVRAEHGSLQELLIVDDDSRDGTEDLIAKRPEPWLKLIVRKQDRGLSQAVLAGLRAARGDILVVMDADLSHPPEVIAHMQQAIVDGADFVVGSRYVPGASTAEDWGLFRFLNSQVATLLARPLTKISDPMSGFFALPRAVFERAEEPSPLGYKIGLELLVRCHARNVKEIPIHFANRTRGESKLTAKQQLLYLQHLARLYRFKLGV